MKPHPPGAVASLVFGILALLAGFIPIVLGIWALFAWFMPVLGVIFGVIAITSARGATRSLSTLPGDFSAGSVHTAGLVTGIIGLVLSLMVGLWCLMIIGLISALFTAAAGGQPMMPTQQPLLW